MEVLTSVLRQGIKKSEDWKGKKTKLLLFINGMMMNLENLKESWNDY